MSISKQDTALIFQVLNEIGIISQLSAAQFGKVLAPDLNMSEFGVLNHFVRVGGAKSPSRLARIFQMSKPSMTAILAKLSAKNYVVITASKEDRRRKIVTITKAGKAARARGISAVAPRLAEIEAGFDSKALAQVLPTLAALREFLDTAREVEDNLKH